MLSVSLNFLLSTRRPTLQTRVSTIMADQQCAVCTQLVSATDISCEYCANSDSTRFYCSALCKHNDLLSHNDECMDMAIKEHDIARAEQAGVVAQALFYTFIENTWAYDMHSMSISLGENDEIDKLEVIHGPNKDPRCPTTCQRTAGDWLFKFPRRAFKSVDPKIKQTLLADQHSVWAFMFMSVALQMLFEGKHSWHYNWQPAHHSPDLVDNVERDIKEVVHYLPRQAKRLIRHHGAGTFVDHRKDLPYPDEDAFGALKGVHRITLSNGTNIALDLAGAQYSLSDKLAHETVMPWTDYLHRWVADIKYRIPLYSHQKRHNALMQNMSTKTHLFLITEQTACFNSLLKNCEYELGFALKDLPYEPSSQFQIYQRSLLTAATAHLLERPRNFDAELAAASDPQANELECLPPDLGPMFRFEWANMSKMIQMPLNKVKLHEKRLAKDLKKVRCVYKMPGDWKMMFKADQLPSLLVVKDHVSENPGWGKKK